ncbi:MAG: tetratricopeptide repeat protein [Gemmatimonadaceae bacterium]|nr:tetratricopeptide repeat protein [Gloeobacterales cyanobacterium ES-bin-141]
MKVDEALTLLDALLEQRKLKDIQELVFRHTWDGWTYPQIAEHAGYDTGHIRDIGSQLWQLLSKALGEPVTKKNVQSVLRRQQQQPATPSQARNVDGRTLLMLPRVHLPVQPNRLIGRDSHVLHCTRLLEHPSTLRLLSLTGPGGTGKTRLAIEVAGALAEEFTDGIYFVPLAPLREAALVVFDIAGVLGVRESTAQSLLASLKSYLRDKHLLLVLDNCEQVQQMAPLVGELLAAAPLLKILTSSRSALKVYGEHEYPVPPLALPDLKHLPVVEQLETCTAIALFVERATAVRPDFRLSASNAKTVAEICTRLDGLPLALELAAARMKLLSAQALLNRLQRRFDVLTGGAKDLPHRQQTLRSAIDWSYELLDAGEKQLFARLGIFAGGGTLEAAAAVCGVAGDPTGEVLEGLASLMDKSLLRQRERADGELHFVMLESLQEYALERLGASGEVETVRRLHARYYLTMAKEVEPELHGPRQQIWLECLEQEYDNLRAVLAWTLEHGQAEVGLPLCVALRRFWWIRGYFAEGRAWMGRMLETSSGRTVMRARVIAIASEFANRQGDYATGRALCAESLAYYRELGDSNGIADSLKNLGNLAWSQRDYPTARALYEESLSLRRALGDSKGIGACLNNLGNVAWSTGEFAFAESLYRQGLIIEQELGDKMGIANRLSNLGLVVREQGHYEAAGAFYMESLVLFLELVDKEGIAINLEGLAGLYGMQGQMVRAVWLLGAAEIIREAIGAPLPPCEQLDRARTIATIRLRLDELQFRAAWLQGRSMTLTQAVECALADDIQALELRPARIQ